MTPNKPSSQEDQDLQSFNPPSSPLFPRPFTLAAIWCTSHIDAVTHLPLSPLLLSFCVVLPIPYRLPFISNSCFYAFMLTHSLCFCQWGCFQHISIMSVSCDSPPCPLSPTSFTLFSLSPVISLQHVIFPSSYHFICLDWTSPYNSSHPSHHSLNGLSPTTISPRSSFPSLSLSR